MKVILQRLVAGPDGVFHPGEVELPFALAKKCLEAGIATAVSAEPEKADAVEPAETAEAPRPARRAKKKRATRKKR